jgi:hypothetical protein
MRVLKLSHFKVVVAHPELNELRPRYAACSVNPSLLFFLGGGLAVKHLGRVTVTFRPLAFTRYQLLLLLSFRAAKEMGGRV